MRLIIHLADPGDYVEGYYSPTDVVHAWGVLSACVAYFARKDGNQRDTTSNYTRASDIQARQRAYRRITALTVIPGGKQ